MKNSLKISESPGPSQLPSPPVGPPGSGPRFSGSLQVSRTRARCGWGEVWGKDADFGPLLVRAATAHGAPKTPDSGSKPGVSLVEQSGRDAPFPRNNNSMWSRSCSDESDGAWASSAPGLGWAGTRRRHSSPAGAGRHGGQFRPASLTWPPTLRPAPAGLPCRPTLAPSAPPVPLPAQGSAPERAYVLTEQMDEYAGKRHCTCLCDRGAGRPPCPLLRTKAPASSPSTDVHLTAQQQNTHTNTLIVF